MDINEVIRREIWHLDEMIENQGFLAFHGSQNKIEKFTLEYVGAEEATDQEGVGIYFSTLYDDALVYTGNNGYVHTVKLNTKKLLDETSSNDVDINTLVWLIKQARDWEGIAQNFSENPESGALIAAQGALDYNEKEKDAFLQIWIDFYRHDPKLFVENMVKLGIDGIIVDRNESKHIIIYNTDIIEIREIENVNNGEMREDGSSYDEDTLMNDMNTDEIRDGGYAGFALEPARVGEGFMDYETTDNNVLKKAINYLKNFNLNKIDDLLSTEELDALHNSYLVASQNIEKVLSMVSDEMKYYNRLLDVQSYLKDRQIIKEDLVYWHSGDATTDDFMIGGESIDQITERVLSWMPKAQSVKVKKNCRLGGNDDGTSDACDQGDMNNIELAPINDDNQHRRKDNVINVAEDELADRHYFKGAEDLLKEMVTEEINRTANGIEFIVNDEIKNYTKKYSSDEELLRNGGFPIDILDKAAFGFTSDEIKQLMPNEIKIKWTEDLEQVEYEVQKSGGDKVKYSQKINLSEPVDVTYEDDSDGRGFYLQDGHHRYYAAKVLGKPLNVNLEIKVNPFKVLAKDLGYDDYHREVWKSNNEELNKNDVTLQNEDTYMGTMIKEADIMSLQELPFKKTIQNMGGKIFSVGGAVRDEFLGKESKDLDILITGIPLDQLETILSSFGKVDAVGKSFGILKFVPRGSTEDIDVAIPRTEVATAAGGHQGFDVQSDHTLPIESDLKRRDFTINAIAKDIDGNLIDPYGGQEDLQKKLIKVVNPEAFSDDPLRMLRAVQFSSRFDFTIEDQTMKMIQQNAPRIKEITGERVLTELEKIVFKGNIKYGVELLNSTGLFRELFGFDSVQTTLDHKYGEVRSMGEFIFLLFNGIQNDSVGIFKTRLKGDVDTQKEIAALTIGWSNQSSDPIVNRSLAHNMYVKFPDSLNSTILPDGVKNASKELLSGRYPKGLKELQINGNDLMSLGFTGRWIGEALNNLLLRVYADKVKNVKEELIKIPKVTQAN